MTDGFTRSLGAALVVLAGTLLAGTLLAGGQVAHARASAPAVDAGYAVAEIVTERQVVVPGDVFLAALRLTIDPNWHVYWVNAGDSGLPPDLRWTDPQGFDFGAFRFPAPFEMPLEGLMNYGYKDELILPFEIRVPDDLPSDGLARLKANAGWLICEDICIPEEAELFLTLELGQSPIEDPAGMAIIGRALSQIPVETSAQASYVASGEIYRLDITGPDIANAARLASSARFYPYGHEILHPADQDPVFGEAGVRLTLTAAPGFAIDEAGLKGVLVFEPVADGARTAFEILAKPGPSQNGVTGLAFPGAGTGDAGSARGPGPLGWIALVGSALLGGLILNLMPCVLPVLSIKAVSLTQAAAHTGGAGSLRRHGLAYAAGVIVSFLALAGLLVALRAAGEQVGVGFQLQQPALVAALCLVMFLVGLNLLGVFEIGSAFAGAGQGLTEAPGITGAFFTGVLAAVVGAPCIGPFLGAAAGVAVTQPAPIVLALFGLIGLGMAMPFLVLSFLPALARRLPRPGAWMNVFKQAMAFPMFAAALWLLWVLAGQTDGSGAVLALVAGMLVVGFALWLVGVTRGRLSRVLGGLILILGLAAPVALAARDTGADPAQTAGPVVASVDGLQTGVWSAEAVAAARAEGKGVFVDFTARWCVTCQVNKQTTLSRPEVRAAMAAANVVFLEADWTNRDEAIARELASHGRAGVPLYLFYAPGDMSGEPAILPQVLSPAFVIERISAAS